MNWPTIISDIQRHGQMTQSKIAEFCDCSQAAVSGLLLGKTLQPTYPTGEALMRLHRKAMQKAARTAKQPVAH